MRILLTLIRKDLALFLRDKAALSLTFLIPVALIYIFGQVFGINRTHPGPSGIPLAVVNASPSPATARLVAALQAEKAFRVITGTPLPDKATRPLTEDDLRPLIRDNQFRFALVIPAGLTGGDSFGWRFRVLSNPQNEIETQTVNGLLQKAIFSSLPEFFDTLRGSGANPRLLARIITGIVGGNAEKMEMALTAERPPPPAESGNPALAGLLANIIQIESEQVVGRDLKSPAATRVVGGWAMMFLLFALSASATSIFDEKKAGIYQRLLAGPVTRLHIVLGKFCWGIFIGVVQLVTLFCAGHFMFGMDVLSHLPGLVLVSVAAAAACTAFGMLLASLAPTAEAARGLATFLILMMSAVGGAWFPISFMPDFIQTIAHCTIVYWAMEGFARVLWAGDSFAQILPVLGVLTGTAVMVMLLAVWRFKRARVFE